MITISLPWPPNATSANASGQGKWRSKSEAARDYKATCAWMLKAQKITPVYMWPFTVIITFNPSIQTAHYDLDNLLGRAKQGLDAVAEAINVNDADWQEMRLVRGKKGGAGSITVQIVPWVESALPVPVVGVIS